MVWVWLGFGCCLPFTQHLCLGLPHPAVTHVPPRHSSRVLLLPPFNKPGFSRAYIHLPLIFRYLLILLYLFPIFPYLLSCSLSIRYLFFFSFIYPSFSLISCHLFSFRYLLSFPVISPSSSRISLHTSYSLSISSSIPFHLHFP